MDERAVGAAVGLGAVAHLESQPTEEQKAALEKIMDPNTPKGEYVVKNDPDIVQMGGLNVRKEARIPLKGEDSNQFSLLKPGDRITGIDWLGRSTHFTSASSQKQSREWVAFTTPDGKVGFVNDKYLQPIPSTTAQAK